MAALARAIELHPTAESFLHLGQLLSQGGQAKEAIDVFHRATAAFPGDERIAAEFGRALELDRQDDQAAETYEHALQRSPQSTILTFYHGGLLFRQGRIARAVELYREFLARQPNASIHSALLHTLHFLPEMTAAALLEEHREWDRLHGQPLRSTPPVFANPREPERRLRIGYLSPDFRNYGVGRFIAPILSHHDRAKFEVFAYSDGLRPDALTQRIHSHADQWRSVHGLTHERLGAAIREDQIDILVDLTMHMPLNRMPVFAARAAPVQVTYLACCSTTGLATMDYRLSDRQLDPRDRDARYVERTIRLPQSWWLYEAPPQAPEIQARPADGPIVYGCLNNFAKVSPDALETWAAVLQAVPESRLLLYCPAGKPREETLALLEKGGVTPGRLEFADALALPDYLALYNRIDIALDPFPYAGGATTCDALWMGVPVVTLLGDMAVGRGSASILVNLGLPELISRTPKSYIRRAVALAGDRGRLGELRGILRGLMLSSPLMNAPAFMAGFEDAFRAMWREWCAKAP
jgi:predicted O-linked N-acetylglucosamine transferase (SPINDLY family)